MNTLQHKLKVVRRGAAPDVDSDALAIKSVQSAYDYANSSRSWSGTCARAARQRQAYEGRPQGNRAGYARPR